MQEIWRDIEGYENLYQVSNLGRVKSLKYGKERIMKERICTNGYLNTCLCKDGKAKYYLTHRLVAKAFIPNPDNLPEINHIDEDITNNNAENLEWCDRKYNNNFGSHNKRMAESKSKKVLCVETGKIYSSLLQVERELGYKHQGIIYACKGKYKQAYGFHWRYID